MQFTRRCFPRAIWGTRQAYVRRHWQALNRFTDDASIPIDNNDCEQLMKRVATGRKNWLFKGSLAAGERAANLMTIIGSAIRNDLDVHAYLEDVLAPIAGRGDRLVGDGPACLEGEHPESIREYRQDERRQAADRKRIRRARRRRAQKVVNPPPNPGAGERLQFVCNQSSIARFRECPILDVVLGRLNYLLCSTNSSHCEIYLSCQRLVP